MLKILVVRDDVRRAGIRHPAVEQGTSLISHVKNGFRVRLDNRHASVPGNLLDRNAHVFDDGRSQPLERLVKGELTVPPIQDACSSSKTLRPSAAATAATVIPATPAPMTTISKRSTDIALRESFA